MKIKFLTLFTLFASSVLYAETAIICEDCNTVSAIESFAKSKANHLECSPVFGMDMTCQSRNKVVTFIDANSNQVYKYNVFHESNAPWKVQVEKMILSPDREESFKILMQFVKDANSSIFESSKNINQLISGSSARKPLTSNSTCPEETALSALTNPNTLDSIKTIASIEIGLNLASKNNDLNLNPVKINKSYSFIFKGLSSSILVDSPTRNRSFVVTFEESERPSSRKDFLAYNVNILGYDEQNIPILDFVLSNSSQVAGYTLGGLKGVNGPLEINNECIQKKFEEAINTGVLTKSNTSSSGSSGGIPESSTAGGIPISGAGCQIVDFYQSGMRLYTFRDCR